MIRIHSLDELGPNVPNKSVVTVGTFDGVHMGHRAVVGRTVECSKRLGIASVVFTFQDHPLATIGPEKAPPALTTREEKATLLEALNPDCLVMVPFDSSLGSMSAADFVGDVLVRGLGMEGLVAGHGFRLGHGGSGDLSALRDFGRRMGFWVEAIAATSVDGNLVSSTSIRNALLSGDLQRANAMLGRKYSLRGRVVAGEGRGRRLGFPTANISPPAGRLLPACGVYLAEADWGHGQRLALVNLGVKPTFGGGRCTIEAHLPGFHGDLYDADMTLRFVSFLRPERAFAGPEGLVRQLGHDLAEARALAAQIYNQDVLW